MEPIDNTTGQKGPKGDKGEKGEIGLQGWGLRGHTGCTGPTGNKGDKSTVIGPVGPTGPTGTTGPHGPIGLTGPIGEKGERGFYGMKGSKGDIGSKGELGKVSDLQTAVFSFGTFSVGHNTKSDIGLLPPGFFMGSINESIQNSLSQGGGLIKIDEINPMICYHSCPFKKMLLKTLSYTITDNLTTGAGSSNEGTQGKASTTVTLPIKVLICKFNSNNSIFPGNDHRIDYYGSVDNKEFTNIRLPKLSLNDNKVNTFRDKSYLLEINTAINPCGIIDLNDIEIGMGEGIGIYIEVNDTIGSNCLRDDILSYLPHPPYPKQPNDQNNWAAGTIKYSKIQPLSMSIMGVYIS